MQKSLVGLVTVIVMTFVVLSGCGTGKDGTSTVCVSGTTHLCNCSATTKGIQICNADGSGYDICQCEPDASEPVDAIEPRPDGVVADNPNEACTSECAGRTCGDDGCQGVCGVCLNPCSGLEDPSLCVNGTCVAPCCPDCASKQCGDDGCGGQCGSCGCGESCTESGSCVFSACEGKECGPNGCEGDCGTCLPSTVCQGVTCVPCGVVGVPCCLGEVCDDGLCDKNGICSECISYGETTCDWGAPGTAPAPPCPGSCLWPELGDTSCVFNGTYYEKLINHCGVNEWCKPGEGECRCHAATLSILNKSNDIVCIVSSEIPSYNEYGALGNEYVCAKPGENARLCFTENNYSGKISIYHGSPGGLTSTYCHYDKFEDMDCSMHFETYETDYYSELCTIKPFFKSYDYAMAPCEQLQLEEY